MAVAFILVFSIFHLSFHVFISFFVLLFHVFILLFILLILLFIPAFVFTIIPMITIFLIPAIPNDQLIMPAFIIGIPGSVNIIPQPGISFVNNNFIAAI